MTNSKVIGVIGLGNAGLPILNNLNKTKKYQLIAYDIDEHKLNLLPENITRASSIKELAQKCHATITCLPKPEHVLQAVEGKKGYWKMPHQEWFGLILLLLTLNNLKN